MNLPEGWPTPEMIEAAKDARLTIPEETLPGKVSRIIFEAMIAAAPESEAEPFLFIKWDSEVGLNVRFNSSFLLDEKEISLYTHPAPPSELVKAAEDAIATLRCLSADKDMAGEWCHRADMAANGLTLALRKDK